MDNFVYDDINKIAVISDPHLGKRMFRSEDNGMNKYETEGYNQFERFINNIINESPEYVIFSGDIFDEPNPKTVPLNVFTFNLKKLLKKNIKILIVSGNHEFSYRNKEANTHCISNIIDNMDEREKKNIINANYEINYLETPNQLFVLVPFLYQSEDKNKELWRDVAQLCKQKNKDKNILISHGVHESVDMFNEGYSTDFVIPDIINEYFDLEIIGHIHAPYNVSKRTNRGICKIISPGATILYDTEAETGPLYINIDNNDSTNKPVIHSVKTIKYLATKDNINDILLDIKNNIYIIDYFGEIGDINEDLYSKALKNSINIQINIKNSEEDKNLIEDIGTFWEFINNKYPQYKDTFNNIKEKIIDEQGRRN